MKIYLLLFLFVIATTSCSKEEIKEFPEKDLPDKIYEGTFYLPTQQAVEEFYASGYTHIKGRLFIGSKVTGPKVHSLDPLVNLKQVDHLGIRDTDLKDLAGLRNLDSVGTLELQRNLHLESLIGLSALRLIAQSIYIVENPSLLNLTGLEETEIARALRIEILRNDELQNLQGLENLISTKSDIIISHNPNLVSLRGLESLNAVDNKLTVSDNASLYSLRGLTRLEKVKGFGIYRNPSLMSVDGLNNLKKGHVSLYNNQQLIDYCALVEFSNYEEASLYISNNAYNPRSYNLRSDNCRLPS